VPNQIKHFNVLGTTISAATYESGLAALCRLAQRSQPAAVCAANTHIISLARHDPDFAQVIRNFDLLLPDGMPLIWQMNKVGAGLKNRVYGPYFMRHALQNLPRPSKHFFFGSEEECLSQLVMAAKKLQPDVDIVGTYSPPFRAWNEEDEESFARIIQENRPDFIWVALGGERQEKWIYKNLHRHKHGVFLAIGDAFELLAGRRPFAPEWMQSYGLTWFYRLAQEPKRLWPRYLKFNSLFTYYLILDIFSGRTSSGKKQTKFKVAFIGSRGVPALYSGFETVVEELGSELAERGHDITVYNRKQHYEHVCSKFKEMKIVWLPTIPTKSFDTIIHTTLSMVHALFCRYDIVYVCGVGNAPLSRLLKLFTHSKIIINVDGADYRRKKWGPIAKFWLRSSESQAVELADALIADNNEVVKRYANTYGRCPVYLSYGTPTDQDRINFGELQRWGLDSKKYFLFVSRLTPENEAEVVIRGYQKFKKKFIDAGHKVELLPKLVIVGSSGYEQNYYRELQGLADKDVIFTGGRFGDAYKELSQNSLAFIMPATIEATRLVLLDQLGFGSVIIYRDCLATREVMGAAGCAFDPDQPQNDLLTQMTYVWENPQLLETLGAQALERAVGHFCWDKVAGEYEKIFCELKA